MVDVVEILNTGLAEMAKLCNGVSVKPFKYGITGTGTNLVQRTDTGLHIPMTGNGGQKQVCTVEYVDANVSKWSIQFDFYGFEDTINVTEFGILNETDVYLLRALLDTAYPVVDGDAIRFFVEVEHGRA